jgi:uncharacterized membrane protein YphA (DoxX/SURF4 family)
MKVLINIARFLVGILFIFSGLVKANDPLGLSYKMQEFFEIWGLHALNDYTLAFSIAMIAFEIVAGVAVLLGWKMNLFGWLLLLLILFFTFLTGYAVITGKPRECGCFGDCIPLSAQQSFQKDLLLLALILFLFFLRKRIKPLFSTRNSVLLLFFSAVFSFALMWYVLLHLPVVDCLPYKVGKNVLAQLKPPPGSIPDSTVITFEYEKDGKKLEFTADNFPEDFNDSIYKNPRRYDKLIRKGNAEPAIKDFSLSAADGQNLTDSILNAPGYKLFLFVRNNYTKGDWMTIADRIVKEAAAKSISSVFITSISMNELQSDPPPFLGSMKLVTCDATAIKTAARANPTLYLLKGDLILEKWSYADFDGALRKIRQLNP